jgi:hypothetical protein
MNGSGLNSRTTDESEAERNNRNVSDLLQELRVAGLGVQVLFSFLLGLLITVRFSQLDGRAEPSNKSARSTLPSPPRYW